MKARLFEDAFLLGVGVALAWLVATAYGQAVVKLFNAITEALP